MKSELKWRTRKRDKKFTLRFCDPLNNIHNKAFDFTLTIDDFMFILVSGSPYVLSIEWLEESMKLRRPAPEEHFLFETKGGVPKNIETPASPLSKKVQFRL